MKESLFLLVLGACWAGYLGWYWRENRRTTAGRRTDGIRAFNQGLGTLGGTASRTAGFAPAISPLAPRTASDAARRRREVLVALGVLAVVSLFAAVAIGGTAIAVHLLIDTVLAAYAYALLQRRNVAAEREIKVHMLYLDQPPENETRQREVVNG